MKSITNVRQEQEKFNSILSFARECLAESYPWLILVQSDTIRIGVFTISHQNSYWVLEKNQTFVDKFSTRSAALAYCAFVKRQMYYLAKRTAELDKKLDLLTLEIQSRKASILKARKTADSWRLDLQLARYLENLSDYQKTKSELKKNIQQAKYMKI